MSLLKKTLSVSLFCLAVLAQDPRGTISGSVTDPSGAPVANARVSAVNTLTNAVFQGVSSAEGVYTIPYLPQGVYSLSVELAGFKRSVRQGIELRISERVTVDFRLELGAMQETVSVTAEAPLLELGTATSGQIVDRRRIAELPLGEGNPLTLVQLAPGIVVTGGCTSNSALSNSGPSNFEVNGSPGGNEFTLDGSPNTADRQTQGAARVGLQPPTDAVAEFKVVTASFDAQQGRTAGGSVDVSMRSGTNELHGTLYEFVRNDILAANSFFNNRQGIPRQARRYNRFGGTVGGPVWIPRVYRGKDRTFFFTSIERIRTIAPELETLTVPIEDFRRGGLLFPAQPPHPALRLRPVHRPHAGFPRSSRPGSVQWAHQRHLPGPPQRSGEELPLFSAAAECRHPRIHKQFHRPDRKRQHVRCPLAPHRSHDQ